MRYICFIILFILIALLAIQNHLMVAAALAILFTYFVSALPLLILAFCIDGFFGAFYHVPLFTIVALLWYAVSELLRPMLMFKSATHGKTS